MTIAGVALALSIFSAVVALGSLAWQVASFALSGPRLKLKLSLVLEPVDGRVLVTDRLTLGSSGARALEEMRADYWMELARLEVTNNGRTPTSIMSSGLLLKCPFTKSPLWAIRNSPQGTPVSRKRHIIRSRDRIGVYGGSVGSFPIRLEPGESVYFVYDFWSIIHDHREERPKDRKLIVRGAAQPAGGRARKSPFHRRWRLSGDVESLKEANISPLQRAYRGFWRVNGVDRSQQIELMWQAGSRALREGHDFATVAGRMARFATDNQLEAAVEMEREYERGI